MALLARLRAGPFGPIVAFVLGVKALVLVHGALSFLSPWNGSLASHGGFFGIWNRWDSLNYLFVAEYGYQPLGDKQHLLAFFPLFPALVRLLEPLFRSFLGAGFAVATVASLAAGVLFHRLAALDAPEADARRALFFLFVFPTSFALHIPYTESLFLAIAFAALLCARSGRWALAGLLGASAALTRVNGVALGVALAVEAWAQYRAERRWRPGFLFLLLVPLGGAGYLLVNQAVTGHAFAFLHYQHSDFNRTVDWPWNGYAEMWRACFRRASAEQFVTRGQEVLFATIMLAGTVVSFFRLRPAYAAYMVVNALLALSYSSPWSVPRFTLILFPLHLLMAQAGRRPVAFALLTAWSLLFLSLFSSLFVRGFWAF